MPDNATTAVPPVSERFHALDGLRAAMMLLGIVLHAVWYMVPVYFGHSITDADANWPCAHFLFWVHVFRMQAFFLVAGFFAHLLLTRRGVAGFVGNRFLRIAAPLVLFTALLYPLMHWQSIRGGLLSGRILSDASSGQLLADELASQTLAEFFPIHFWFLYCLLLLYGLALAALLVLRLPGRRGQALRTRLEYLTARVASSPWGLLVVAVPVAVLLSWNITWAGVNAGPLKPHWTGVLAYGAFFAVGWCLHARPEVLTRYSRGWAARLTVGTALALVLSSLYFDQVLTGRDNFAYPMFNDGQLLDYAHLRHKLLDARDGRGGPVPAKVWANLSPAHRRFVEEHTSPTTDQRTGLLVEIGKTCIAAPGFLDPAAAAALPLAPEWRALADRPPDDRPAGKFLELNRKALEAAFAPALASLWQPSLTYRAAYFYAYALASWLLVFGFVGLFQRFCSRPSPAVRYLSDSSYWLYILHLPLQFELLLWLAPVALFWPAKLALYTFVPLLIMIPSYHFLVRPTVLGWLLNGRRHPRDLRPPVATPPEPTLTPIPIPVPVLQTVRDDP